MTPYLQALALFGPPRESRMFDIDACTDQAAHSLENRLVFDAFPISDGASTGEWQLTWGRNVFGRVGLTVRAVWFAPDGSPRLVNDLY